MIKRDGWRQETRNAFTLTPREDRILKLSLAGMDDRAIAAELNCKSLTGIRHSLTVAREKARLAKPDNAPGCGR